MPRRFPDDEGFDKVNFIIDSWTTGCDAPWYIYIETMKPAALEAFIVILSFGWADVLRGFLRPKGLGRRTSKRKGRWNRRIPRFPEVGNTIGKSLPFAEQLDDFVKWGNKTRFLWRIDNAMQAGLFFWLVADVAEDFVFNWTSLLYESYWCQPDPPGNFSYRTVGKSPDSGHVWQLAGFGTEDYENAPPEWLFSVGTSGPNGCMAAAALEIEKHPAFPAPTSFAVRIYSPVTGEVFGQTGPNDTRPDGSGSEPVSAQIPPNQSFRVRFWHDAPWALVGDGVVMAVETLPS